jgi:transposase, IS6 family
MKAAGATLKGFEIMRMIRRGHCIQRERRATGEIRVVNQLFGLVT